MSRSQPQTSMAIQLKEKKTLKHQDDKPTCLPLWVLELHQTVPD